MRPMVAVLGMALVLSACSGDPKPDGVSSSPPGGATSDVTAAPVPPATTSLLTTKELAYLAISRESSIPVFDGPDGTYSSTVDAVDVLTVPDQTPLTFLIKRVEGSWAEVYLPVRPNGTTGWVMVEDIAVSTTDFRIEVSLVDFSLQLFRGSDEVLSTAVGIGRGDRPTPGGVYFIRELLQPPEPDGIYGPYAYGLSGYSPVLDEFNGGQAIIGLHGTNDPDSFGSYVSSGCVRLPNDVITQLVTEFGLPLGTPVYISEE